MVQDIGTEHGPIGWLEVYLHLGQAFPGRDMTQKNMELGYTFADDWKRQSADIDFATYKFDPFINEDFRGSLTFIVNDVDLSFPSVCLLDFAKNMIMDLSRLTLFEEPIQRGFPDTEFWIGMAFDDGNIVLSCNYLPEQTRVPFQDFALTVRKFVESLVSDCVRMHPGLTQNYDFAYWFPHGWYILRRVGVDIR